jgi:probable selenium-dependent hydroxylase accessory protein YqeC
VSDLVDLLQARSGIVCAIGAGGKKTTLYALTRRHPGRLALTTTVQNTFFPDDLPVETVLDDAGSLARRVAALPRTAGVAYACRGRKSGRHAGVEPAEIERIHRECGFDVTLVKADGARMRWIKSPKAGEPIMPASTGTALVIVSVRALGEPLTDRIAHRPERVAAVSGCALEETFTPAHLGALLCSEEGLLRGTAGMAVVPIINMVDDATRRELAEEAAHAALASTRRFDRVILASMRNAAEPVVAVIER